jgi:hypothetical protein
MKNSRRAFLQAAGFAPAVAVTGFAAAAPRAAGDAGELRRSHFAPLAGERFEFEQDVFDKVGAKLASATPLVHATDGERSFRLLFEAETGKRLAEGSWRVTHPALGTVVMFVSPNDAEGRVAEAIFNRA